MKNCCITLGLILTLSGCERSRSFLQMDSNSRSPFLGLQLSVDATDATKTKATDSPIAPVSYREEIVAGPVSTAELKKDSALPVASRADREFVTTADSRKQTGNLKFSLPKIDLTKNPKDAAEVQDILTRL